MKKQNPVTAESCSGIVVGVFLGSCWVRFGIVLGSFWGSYGVVFGIVLTSFGLVLETCWVRFGFVLKSFWDRFGIVVGSFWVRFGIVPRSCWEMRRSDRQRLRIHLGSNGVTLSVTFSEQTGFRRCWRTVVPSLCFRAFFMLSDVCWQNRFS